MFCQIISWNFETTAFYIHQVAGDSKQEEHNENMIQTTKKQMVSSIKQEIQMNEKVTRTHELFF